ncbi:EutN/CcmL family microcompartment protein [Cerasicoccus maritimus]|uniref:EutN/CcmL family microcompartment protein n=1 Tax=Cerasicoccus maritimus TaxID=490089 RepID=UPI0028528EE9|nr:EutN/CcmL family microcompartment protein [Cerasicoccus maritimus]
MIRARVEGNVVSTMCHETMRGWRLLICQPIDEEDRDLGQPVMAIDPQGAGVGSTIVITTDGKGVREFLGIDKTPIRNMILAIEDE